MGILSNQENSQIDRQMFSWKEIINKMNTINTYTRANNNNNKKQRGGKERVILRKDDNCQT